MTRKIDIVFNSQKDNDKIFQIASGYISETTILFEKEDIVALVHAKGRVEFYNTNGELLAVGEVPTVVNGKEVYQEISCQAENNTIILGFPIYKWIDNYPHCDGEHDRWDTKIIGYHNLTFDISTKAVTCS